MRVLIACEFSGIVRDAFIKKGHDAVSCDLLYSERPGPHIKGNVLKLLKDKWDLVVAHPPCTYLCNSGVRWLFEENGRWEKMVLASEFFNRFLELDTKVCVENPIPHRYAKLKWGYNQIIHPYQFGHIETKSICLWLKDLPPLTPTTPYNNKRYESISQEGPSTNRTRNRSRFFNGIAQAMAAQWSISKSGTPVDTNSPST